jgi:hypothetical protein
MAKKAGPAGTAPKGGKQPQQKKPATTGRTKRIAKGAPTHGGGSDLNPYSSARRGGK